MNSEAIVVLEDGTVFEGISIGVPGVAAGELVFNTAHVGYQEALTDPSYAGQMIVFTSPHIGNVGCNSEDEESPYFWTSGVILREKPQSSYYWRSECDFQTYLEKHHVVGIAEIDTRYLTQLLRKQGHVSACIMSDQLDVKKAQEMAIACHEVRSHTLLEKVTTPVFYTYKKTSDSSPHIVVYDFGIKKNILRFLDSFECHVTVIPASTSIQAIRELKPDGILLSNGPGDPLRYVDTIEKIKILLHFNLPLFGICLGHQLLGLALGARIEKLKFGHHGINHPIQHQDTKRVQITSQNHNFALSDGTLPADFRVIYRSLFDNSIQGIQHISKPIFSIQGHPEGCPGPTEIHFLFEQFLLATTKQKIGLTPCLDMLA